MGLLDSLFNTQAPDYSSGLLGDTADLQRRANTTGLVNMALGYLAAPKNQNLGLGRILAGSYVAGQQGAQGTYDNALNDWQMKSKIEEYKKKQEQDGLQQEAVNNIANSNPELGNVLKAYPSAAPSILSEMYKPKGSDSPYGKIDPKDYTPDSMREFALTKDYTKLVQAPKPSNESDTPDKKNYEYAKNNGYTGSFTDFIKIKPLAMMPIAAANLGVAQGNLGVAQEGLGIRQREADYNLPSAPKPQANFSIKTPDGMTHSFKDKKSLNNFRLAAGLK